MKKYCPYCMEPLSNGLCKNGCVPYVSVDARVLRPGTVLHERYLVGRVLGQGGFGITYIGRDLTLDTCVAIKEYFPTQMVIRDASVSLEIHATSQKMSTALTRGNEKFLEEAQILARFRGEKGIVDVLDFFQQNNTAYIIMEYIDGQTLQSYLDKSGKLPPNQVFSLMAPVMASLDRLHQAGLIHRDISPDNIMITFDGQVKLLDFGTVRNANLDGDNSLTVMVRHGYAPEEQYSSTSCQGPWTDVYALCATMYKCITGLTPDDSRHQNNQNAIQPPSQMGIDISPSQEIALMKGMARDYKKRFQSVGTLAAALYPNSPPPVPPEPWFKRHWKKLAIGGAAALVLVLALAVLPKLTGGTDPAVTPSSQPTQEVNPAEEPVETDNSISEPVQTRTPPEPSASSWLDNVMMGDTIDTSSVNAEDYNKYPVFGSAYTRNMIRTVTVLDSLDERPDGAWDISEDQDGSVMAWVDPNGKMLDLYIGAEGGVSAPVDSSFLFAGYESVESIRFNGMFHTSKVKNMSYMFYLCSNLEELDVSGFDTSKVTDMYAMFAQCVSLEELDVSGFDTSKVTNMRAMFWKCSNLEELDVSGFDTSRVTTMRSMFAECSNLEELDVSGFDTSRVTTMRSMFSSCNNIEALDVSGFDTSKVTDMYAMFNACNSLEKLDVSGFDTSQVTDMYAMFLRCGSLEALDVSGFDTSRVTNMYAMFGGCSSLDVLDVSGFDTSKVTDMRSMFWTCSNLEELDVSGFDTSKVTDMRSMFSTCSSLKELDVSGFDTSTVTVMRGMFQNCSSLDALDVSGFDTSSVTDMYAMFYSCGGIKTLDLSNFNTSKVTDMGYMFGKCGMLTTLHVKNWSTSGVNTEKMFDSCSLPQNTISSILSGYTVST